MHDLVIRGGTVVDGSGGPCREADVAIDGDRIAVVGTVPGRAREEIDARGLLVTPGFVDIHTHYDGQALWDPILAPSCWHGVTTVVVGNCGVGFAPARPDRHDWLIGLMEGVEDIPGAALAAGLPWDWESFPEYLDALERLPRPIDVGAHVPHGAAARLRHGRSRRAQRAGDPERHRARWRASCARRSRPARSASRPRARSGIARSTASRCPARSRARTSCSRSGARWPRPAAASSRWRRPGPAVAPRATHRTRPRARWDGCAGWPRRRSARSASSSCRTTRRATLWRRLLDAHRRGGGVGGAPGATDREPSVRHARRPPDAREPVRRAADLPGDRVAAARRSASPACATATVRARILGERPPGRPVPGTLSALFGPAMMRAALPARRSARLRAARPSASVAAIARARGPRPGRGPVRSHARLRRPRAAALSRCSTTSAAISIRCTRC